MERLNFVRQPNLVCRRCRGSNQGENEQKAEFAIVRSNSIVLNDSETFFSAQLERIDEVNFNEPDVPRKAQMHSSMATNQMGNTSYS